MNARPIDVSRLIRIATLLFTLLAGSLVYLAYEPHVADLQARLDDAESELRSDDIAFSEVPRLQADCSALATRYDGFFTRSEQAAFLRELSAAVRRHDVDLLSTTIAADDPAGADPSGKRARFRRTHVSLELHGSYAHLLTTIAELSDGAGIVSIDTPALRRDGDAITASVPMTLVEPATGGAE